MKIFRPRLSIRTQMFVLVLSVFLPAVAIFAWHVLQELHVAREDAYDSVKRLADETAARLGEIIRHNEAVLGRLATRPLIKAFDGRSCDPILRGYVSLHPEFSTLALRDSHANVVCTLIANPPPAQEVKVSPWFQEATRSGKFTVGDASIMPAVGRWVSISAFPVHDSLGNVSGVVFFSLNLLKLNQHLFRSLPKNALVAVIDRQNRFLLRSLDPGKWIGQSIQAENADAVRGQGEGYFSRHGPDGVHRLYAFTTVPGTGWRVFAGLPEDQVFAASQAWLARSMLTGLAVLLLVLALAWRIGSAIVKPIDELARASAKISSGEISARAQVAGPTEIQAVALQFNRMLDMRERAQTELMQSEARFRTVADYTHDWEYWQGPRHEIFYMSPSCKRITGYSREEFLSNPDLLTAITLPDDRHLIAAHFSAADTFEQMAMVDYRIVRRDGEIRWIAHACRAVYAPDGQSMGRRVSNRDITERKQAEAARSQLEAQLRESQKMEAVGTLAGGIAHDFNNILAAILGNVALAKKDLKADHVAMVSVEEINKAATRAKNLVQQILAFSRRQPQNLVSQALQPLVEETLGLLRATLPAGVELTVTLSPAPLYVRADATQIQQVLMNLCTNAWQALKGNAGRIAVGLDQISIDAGAAKRLGALPPGRYARLWVNDNGCGMDEATQARIFEPFFTTKSVGHGTGLGMAVVHGIITAHQGAITVESAVGKGTTFEVFLPPVQAPIQVARPVTEAPTSANGKDRHVLYVDDDEAMVFLVTRMLQDLDYRVSGYEHAEVALEAIRANPADFDLAVTDFNMPGLSGLEVARELARIRPELPVVITSGYITEELQASALAAGVRHVIYKPNTADELCQRIQLLLETENARATNARRAEAGRI